VTTAATAMDPRIRARVADFLADLDRDPVAADVLGVVVSGSAARARRSGVAGSYCPTST